MKKRLIALLLLAAMAVSMIVPAYADIIIMYVYTDNGKALNVRAEMSTNSELLGRIPFGDEVQTISEHANHWMEILYKGKTAFVMSRFLVEKKPKKKPTPTVSPEEKEHEKQVEELNKQLKALKALDTPINLTVRPSRASGWVNFRSGPGVAASRVATFGDGKLLRAVGETPKWYQAIDPETNKMGFISKGFVNILPATEAASEQLGTLTVNGKFNLQCKMPEGYTLQVVNMLGSKIVASLNPTAAGKPVGYLSIAFDETYSDVARMNDLSAEELTALENTYKEMNEVEISYSETSHGTKLMIAREVGSDTDFVDILSIYEGYFVEFILTPNTNSASQTLTDEQIQMCIDFLSDVDFIPVK